MTNTPKTTPKSTKKMMVTCEHEAYLYVNFTDYLDTGLFIDHRNIRKTIKEESRGKDVLNLFAYTCTASVHSAIGGAKSITSVDLSANYLNWGKQNFALNGLNLTAITPDGLPKYQFIAADVFGWLRANTEQYDLIFIDPPTFSNSKKFKGTFDVQRDHVALISRAMNRLRAGGVLYFSNNFTKFVLDDELKNRYDVVEMTDKTIGVDFNPKKPIHQSFKITHKNQTARVYEFESIFDAVNDEWQDDVKNHQGKNDGFKPASKHFKGKPIKPSYRPSDKLYQDKSDDSRLQKEGFKDKVKKDNDKKSHDDKPKFFDKSFDKRQHFKGKSKDNRQVTWEAHEPVKPNKPKIRYEKINGKLVGMSIDDTPLDASKKYTIKPKS